MFALADNFPSNSTAREDAITASAGSIRTEKVPSRSRVVLYDTEHIVDLAACRRRMPYRVAELMATGQKGSGRELIANAADVDLKTLRTFLDGGRVSPESLAAIIEGGLGLKFIDIVKPVKVA